MPSLKAAILPVTPFQQNCTLLWDTETMRGVVVDPGGEAARIAHAVQQVGCAITTLLLTHGHVDHAGGAMELRRLLAASGQQARILGPDQRDKFLLDDLVGNAKRFGLTGVENCAPDGWLSEGDSVEIAGLAFAARHCPGHTPGHLVYVNQDVGLALVGDVLFRGSVGRTDFPYGDHAALLDSIAAKLLPLGDAMSFICGHGPGSTIGAERRGNPFLAGLPGTGATAHA